MEIYPDRVTLLTGKSVLPGIFLLKYLELHSIPEFVWFLGCSLVVYSSCSLSFVIFLALASCNLLLSLGYALVEFVIIALVL